MWPRVGSLASRWVLSSEDWRLTLSEWRSGVGSWSRSVCGILTVAAESKRVEFGYLREASASPKKQSAAGEVGDNEIPVVVRHYPHRLVFVE